MTTLHPLSAKVGTNFATSGGRSVYKVHSPTQATDFVCIIDDELKFGNTPRIVGKTISRKLTD
jgi:hypothetical protein